MWEKRIVHAGLNAFRLVRGETEEEVELKASLQLAQWEDRWQKRLRVEKSRDERSFRQYQAGIKVADGLAAKAVASERTRDLEAERDTLTNLLVNGCANATTLDWKTLKTRTNYSVPPPSKPTLQPIPAIAEFEQTDYVLQTVSPQISLLDKFIPAMRRKKVALAEQLNTQYALEAESRAAKDVLARQLAEEKHRQIVVEVQRANEDLKKTYSQDFLAWDKVKKQFEEDQFKANSEIDRWRERYLAKEESAVTSYCYEILARSQYPDDFPREHFLQITPETKALVLDFELPSQSTLPSIKEIKYVVARSSFQEIPVSDVWLKKTFDDVLYQVCLRTIYELFSSDEIDILRSIVFNGWVRSIDRATGSEVHACVMSLEAGKDEFLAITLSQVDPKACFKKLKGVSASKLIELSPVKPLVVLNKVDRRFVDGYAVADTLDERTNLAAMDWLDFENLIREVFEKEFSKGGGEVKITQASRDGGVDAIAFDPDPIRGGKLVIQAKRYTNTVGVSAVRDLYGTVHNEGANKGILVTTSDFGPDAYAFAKDKPLTLISGGELLYLLARHGHSAKIDLAEAKRIAAENAT